MSKIKNPGIQFDHEQSKAKVYFKHIEGWLQSGLSREAYCKKHGLKLSTFGYWRKKQVASDQKSSQKNNFIQLNLKKPVETQAMVEQKQGCQTIEILLPNRIKLIGAGLEGSAQLLSLVQALGRVTC